MNRFRNGLRPVLAVVTAAVMLTVVVPSARPAGEHDAALQAMRNGDYGTALQQWQQLASGGDVVARFNLGLMYERGLGVEASGRLAARWYRAANQSHFVEAYHRLNGGGVRPAPQTVSAAEYDTQQWVSLQNPEYFTLQLASSKNVTLIEKYLDDDELRGRAGYYRSERNGEQWYALVYGAFPSSEEARASVATLPDNLRKWSPCVRPIKDIHRVMQH
ncbi:MAG: SPOR domain-containing protein [Pseudomonadota bacterium]|nr:MAG: SPOR domain-containing protein [Pseudomonadota bacterium]